MTTTSDDSIVAFIKEVRAQDRRADRERIAELERDAAHLRTEIEQLCRHIKLVETDFAASLEKCAALVVENKRLSGAVQTAIKNAGKDVLLEDKTPAVEVKRTPKVGDSVRLTVSGWEGETAKIVDVKEQSAALALDEDVKRFSFDCFEVIE